MNVDISPLLCGFIWKFRRIIAQAGILWLKTFYVIAEKHTGSSGRCTPDDRQPFCRPFLLRPTEHWPHRKAHSICGARASGTRAGSVSPAKRSPWSGSWMAMVRLACRAVIDDARVSSRPSSGHHPTRAWLSSKDVRSGATMAQRPKKWLDHVREAIPPRHDSLHTAHAYVTWIKMLPGDE
jgi:hypothetical protein